MTASFQIIAQRGAALVWWPWGSATPTGAGTAAPRYGWELLARGSRAFVWRVASGAGGGAQTVSILQATETDTAQALTVAASLSLATGQALETDAAQVMTPAVSGATAIGQALETDLAQPTTAVPGALSVAIGQAVEAESAQAMGVSVGFNVGIGLALEIDTAGAFTSTTGPLVASIAQATEADSASAVSVFQPGATIGEAAHVIRVSPDDRRLQVPAHAYVMRPLPDEPVSVQSN